MAASIELLIVAVSSALLVFCIWRVTRRVLTGGSLDVTVSREWLLRHQADDHS